MGAVGVVELEAIRDVDALRRRFAEAGMFVRPFDGIVYLTPAFTVSEEDLSMLTGAIVQVLRERAW
jgi:adenosylmethionine-8-amino-7-oxononanoate aminotransferase